MRNRARLPRNINLSEMDQFMFLGNRARFLITGPVYKIGHDINKTDPVSFIPPKL